MQRMIWLLAIVTTLCSCRSANDIAVGKTEDKTVKIEVTSAAFNESGAIPDRYTCRGSNVSPALSWTNIPTAAETVALVVDDPEAPSGTWVHWVLYNLPAHINELPEAVPNEKHLANGAFQGLNSSGEVGYRGPCPPSGTHRYFFKVYALDTELDRCDGMTGPRLLEAMKGHILAEGELMGKFRHK